MTIIPRKAWGARFAAGFGAAPRATELWLHHSVTRSAGPNATAAEDAATLRKLEDIGQQRFKGGISYTFVVCESGRVHEGTGPGRKGAHTGGRNSVARAICLLGDYSRRRPTDAQLQAVAGLVRHGHAVGWWTVDRLTGGHRDAPGASTSCPGDAAYALIPVINSKATTAHLADDLEDDMNAEDRDRLARVEAGVQIILQQMIGPGATITEPWPGPERGGGWPTFAYGDDGHTRLTLMDYMRLLHRELLSAFQVQDAPTDWRQPTTPVGHLLAVRALALQLEQLIANLGGRSR